ncbi:MAG: hypothetical protein U0271_12770 [Polyangiaceae bacterium]
MKTSLVRYVAAAGLSAAMVTPVLVAGCQDDNITNPLNTLCCTQFKPGTNMLDTDWGIDDPALNAEFSVAMQAVGDFSAASGAMVTDLATVCRNMAVELGEAPDAVTNPDPREQARQWCQKAADQLSTIRAQITITYQPAECSFRAEVQAECEGKCDVNGTCDPGSVEVRCEPGQLSVKCEGEFSCKGTCEGSANVAVTCTGACEGSCEGQCDGTPTAPGGAACAGTCEGTCRGSCQVDPNVGVECEGECVGDAACTGTATAPKCKGQLDPPNCDDVSADCEASCNASATAKAECTPPAVVIEGTAELAQRIAVLKKYLPEIITIAEARLTNLVTSAEAMVTVTGNLQEAVDTESTAGLCVIPAAVAIDDAGQNFAASVEASGSVMTEVLSGI